MVIKTKRERERGRERDGDSKKQRGTEKRKLTADREQSNFNL